MNKGDKRISRAWFAGALLLLALVGSLGVSIMESAQTPAPDMAVASSVSDSQNAASASLLTRDSHGYRIPAIPEQKTTRDPNNAAVGAGQVAIVTPHRVRPKHKMAAFSSSPHAANDVQMQEDDLAMPKWREIISPDGAAIDLVGREGRGGSDGIPDYLELYPAFEAGYVEEVISNGVATDMSALLIARDVSDEVLYNGAVRPEHDLGNAFYLLSVASGGNLRIYVGVERLLSDLPTFIEFELNQEQIHLGSGVPWWEMQGARRDGDLLVRFNLVAGSLTSVELAQWQNNGYLIFESDTDGLGLGCKDKFSYLYCMSAPPLDRSDQDIEVWDSKYLPVEPTLANSFAELGLDLGRLLGSASEFSGLYIRTPEDVVMTSFHSIGDSASGGVGLP